MAAQFSFHGVSSAYLHVSDNLNLKLWNMLKWFKVYVRVCAGCLALVFCFSPFSVLCLACHTGERENSGYTGGVARSNPAPHRDEPRWPEMGRDTGRRGGQHRGRRDHVYQVSFVCAHILSGGALIDLRET